MHNPALESLLLVSLSAFVASAAKSVSTTISTYTTAYSLNWNYNNKDGQWHLYSLTKLSSKAFPTITNIPDEELVYALPSLRTLLKQYLNNGEDQPPAITHVLINRPVYPSPDIINVMIKSLISFGLQSRYLLGDGVYFFFFLDKNPFDPKLSDTFVVEDYYKIYPDMTFGRSDTPPPLNFTTADLDENDREEEDEKEEDDLF